MQKPNCTRSASFVSCLILFLISTSLAFAQAPQCSNGVDDDNDGGTDALVYGTPDNNAQFTLADRDSSALRAFQRQKAAEYGYTQIRDRDPDSGQVMYDSATALFLCQLAGYTRVVTMDSRDYRGRHGYSSPHNNTMGRWRADLNDFEILNAKKAGNRWIATLVCGGKMPACSDGIDNDGDGVIDFSDDPGCDSANDDSELIHDPDCDGPNDDSEQSDNQCNDGIDNDGDGQIDYLNDSGVTSGQATFGVWQGKANPHHLVNLVNAQMDAKGLPFTRAREAFTRKTGVSGGGNRWKDNGHLHMPTLNKVCEILGYQTYVSSTYLDGERSGRYPFGKANFHSPHNNKHTVWNGSNFVIQGASPKYGKHWISSITCRDPLPVCSDGLDNDGDGRADGQDDGCANGNDSDERPHDTNCTGPDDDSEFPDSQCSDGIDNDGDGLTDHPQDPGCSSPEDNDERTGKQCDDGIDNDGDGAIDFPADTGCTSVNDDDERSGTACDDGVDNDGDGLTDFPQDPGCSSPNDNDERTGKQCDDGQDNDGDGATDWPNDDGCTDINDDDERKGTACDDGVDNDGDGAIDWPADPGCSSKDDNDERTGTQCDDGVDNDGDGATDWPNDDGCTDINDDDERKGTACDDGVDNDGDGATDWPNDPGCTNKDDNDERTGKQCDDGVDNDGDGATDWPNDDGCTDINDDDERKGTTCDDGLDNDGDGATDWPADPGCSSKDDDDERTGKECDDGKDNDGDGATDWPNDDGCRDINDDSEYKGTQCDDGVDNDGDGKKDFPKDPGCDSKDDNDERTGKECDDGVDNDGDGATDWPNDDGCTDINDDDERKGTACDDGIDNDGDGATDWPNDPGCENKDDNDERTGKQCDDGQDNDGDGATDWPNDDGCTDINDDDERMGTACDDGIDNDNDGFTDFPNDPGCDSKADDSERDPNGPACDNGKDDDGDSLSDFPQDPGCTGPTDTDEYNCTPGAIEERDCTTGGQGVCEAGTQTRVCGQDYQWAEWGACEQNIQAYAEVCSDNLDNDCDGVSDSADPDCFECNPGAKDVQTCSSGLQGVCEAGQKVRDCVAGFWTEFGACEADVEPGTQAEICDDQLDNDCDGDTDIADLDCDQCPNDPSKIEPGTCGCGLPEAGFTSYAINWENPPSSGGAGIPTNYDIYFSPETQTLRWVATYRPNGANIVPDGFQLAVNAGNNPKGHDGELAFFYYDVTNLSDPKLTVYGYNGVSQDSWQDGSRQGGIQPPDKILSSLVDPSFVKEFFAEDNADGTRTIGFVIDATAINKHSPLYPDTGGQPWQGAQWSAVAGMWFHATTGLQTAYGADGFLTSWTKTNLSFTDTNELATIETFACGECLPFSEEPQVCQTGEAGVCGIGERVRSCGEDGYWEDYGSCVGNVQPGSQVEICDDGLDNDCDGDIDNADTDCDQCPNDPNKTDPGTCGCGNPETGFNSYAITWENPAGSQGAGIPVEYDIYFSPETQTMGWIATYSPNGNGILPDGFQLAVNAGNNPKGHDGELAFFYYDATSFADPKLTVYGYNGVSQDSWKDGSREGGIQPPDKILSSVVDPSFVKEFFAQDNADGTRTIGFVIDATAINKHNPLYPDAGGQPWQGAQWSSVAGMWFHATAGLQTSYGADGFLTNWAKTALSVSDTNALATTETFACGECIPGEEEPQVCQTGEVGLCATGERVRTCGSDGFWGDYGACVADVEPGAITEICDDGLDNDCDGDTDTDDNNCWECQPGEWEQRECASGLPGVCQTGDQIRHCSDTGEWREWSECTPHYQPDELAEDCFDDKDNDCDGLTDRQDPACFECDAGEAETRTCDTGFVGACAAGEKTRTCGDDHFWGDFGGCQTITEPGSQAEICGDGEDNDCDGKTDNADEDCFECVPGTQDIADCATGLQGICDAGQKVRDCVAGFWTEYGACEGAVEPGAVAEVCDDGFDNDCDGDTDTLDSDCFECEPDTVETESCSSGEFGVCDAGSKSRTCDAGFWSDYSACEADIQPGSIQEVCDDQIDNDCDGDIDALDIDCDQCPDDPDKIEPGTCGCGFPDSGFTSYALQWQNPPNSNLAGIPTEYDIYFSPETQTLRWVSTYKAAADGTLPDGFQFAVNAGGNPKGHDGELAFFYFDASNFADPKLTVYGYNALSVVWDPAPHAGTQTSWQDGSQAPGIQPPDKILSSVADPSFVKEFIAEDNGDGTVTIGFVIDATAINKHTPLYPDTGGQPWQGAQWSSVIGLWFHATAGLTATYGADGYLTHWHFAKLGWTDTNELATLETFACGECIPGEEEPQVCQTGEVGICGTGERVRVCGQDSYWEDYGSCVGAVEPGTVAEICDDGLDNDCDGSSDLDDDDCWECQPGDQEQQDCASGLEGLCSTGDQTRTCGENGQWEEWGACNAHYQPDEVAEDCFDEKDNDCNGLTDREDPACFECDPGAVEPRECDTGYQGICAAGEKTRTCGDDHFWGDFSGCGTVIEPGSVGEVCDDGFDNDCDGKTDSEDSDCWECQPGESEQEDCNTGMQGVCAGGFKVRTCKSNGTWSDYSRCMEEIRPDTQAEQCSDNLDNDCDGKVDDADPACFECDPGSVEDKSCSSGAAGICETGTKQRSCGNDGKWSDYGSCESDIEPGSIAEVCGDGKDNDCDGDVDDADTDCYECQPGTEEPASCDSGEAGICGAGTKTRTCGDDGKWGSYGSCDADIAPGSQGEVCGDGKDNDCDGDVDDADTDCYECQPGIDEPASCDSGEAGICGAGTKTRTCGDNGKWGSYGSCDADIAPGSQGEVCGDGKDNDCDGAVDDADTDCFECEPGTEEPASCDSGEAGICGAGTKTRTCGDNGKWGSYGSCDADIAPGSEGEVCGDGKDNDCDGKTDSQDDDCWACEPGNVDQASCNSAAAGICGPGTKARTCGTDGQWSDYGACNSDIEVASQAEICDDGLDNDCDGSTDSDDNDCWVCSPGEVEEQECDSGEAGICGAGTKARTCGADGQWSEFSGCTADIAPASEGEVCGDSLDNDCDGQTDEADSDCFACDPGSTESVSCNTGEAGACNAGEKTRTCGTGGQWSDYGSCEQLTQGSAEICGDGIDNDCDGMIDDDDLDCVQCSSVNNTEAIRTLDGNSRSLGLRVKALAREYRRRAKKRTNKRWARNAQVLSVNLSAQAWPLAWKLPTETQTCTLSVQCEVINISGDKQAYLTVIKKLKDLRDELETRLKSTKKGRVGGRCKKALNEFDALFAGAQQALASIAEVSSSCNS